MNLKTKALCAFTVFLFMGSMAFSGANAYISIVSANSDNLLPAATYGDDRRHEPVNILIYNELTDLLAGGEYDNLMASLISSLEGKFTYDNLTDYSQLGSMIGEYDVLLLAEQEWSNDTFTATVNAAWAGILPSFVANGGIVIAMAFDFGHAYTAGIINGTLIDILNPSISTGNQIDLFDVTDALARNVPASYTAADGTLGFDCPDAVKVMEDNTNAKPVAVHKTMGKGHVVVLGLDMYTVDAVQDTLLMNSVLLHRHILIDNSHTQILNINAGLNEMANDLPYYGFSVSSMDTFEPSLITNCDILMIPMCTTKYNSTEINIIRDFVENGGGLFLMSEIIHFGNGTDEVLNEFGYSRNVTGMLEDSDEYVTHEYWPRYAQPDNFAMHSVNLGVDVIEVYGSTGLISMPAGAVPLVYTDTDGTGTWDGAGLAEAVPIAAASLFGSGRVFILCDSGPVDDTDYDSDGPSGYMDSDNELFTRNAFRWLSGAGIPEQTIVFDQSHNPLYYLWSSYQPLANFLMFNGYNVEFMSQFTPTAFADADILAIVDGSLDYNASEINYIADYVAGGGGLFLIGDHTSYFAQVDPIAQEFGLEYNNTGWLEDTDDYNEYASIIVYEPSNFANHPIMDGVERIEVDRSTGFISIGAGTALISTDNDNTSIWSDGSPAENVPVFAATLFNMGRVVAVTDVNMGELLDSDSDGFGDLYDSDNPIFMANVFKWLAENRAPSVEVLTPNGGEVINGTITVEWNSIDFDSDPLTFEVWYTDNNGSDWNLLDDGITVDEYQWNTTLHDDGTGYMIRVVVSDGMATAQDDSDAPFELDNYVGGGPGIPLDPMMLLIIGAAALVVIIIIVIVMKKKK